jgi:pimeloyl-ACP methyl ester carboxylesterase
MGEHVEAGGLRTWYDERREGDPVVLMHGGVVDSRFLRQEHRRSRRAFRVFAPERRGHGHTPGAEGPITYDSMAKDMIVFMEAVVTGPAQLVGHSDGAFVCLLIAIRRADLVRKLRPKGAFK